MRRLLQGHVGQELPLLCLLDSCHEPERIWRRMHLCTVFAGVDILTFGQYLQPTPKHLDVVEFVTPEKFEHWRRYGEEVIGFRCTILPPHKHWN